MSKVVCELSVNVSRDASMPDTNWLDRVKNGTGQGLKVGETMKELTTMQR